jgi:Peptidase A4 family
MRRFAPLLTVLVSLGLGAGAPAARADTVRSSNWSGYVAHHSGLRFRSVSAVWRQPRARCTAVSPAYSAIWVGLGGFVRGAKELEQVGTELDCSASGAPISTAWYELVPAASVTIRMPVAQGDVVAATVTVVGNRVTLKLSNRTRHRSFVRTLHARQVDISSADWIVESPSACWSPGSCQTLPLADFGSVHMRSADAQSARGRRGPISSRRWNHTTILLSGAGQVFVGSRATAGRATPSALEEAGSAFDVNYAQVRAGSPAGGSKPGGSGQVVAGLRSLDGPPAVQPGGPLR